jgi:hypothetical protein
MAAGRIILPGFMPCEDTNGDRVAGAKAYFYLNNSATLTTVYADEALSERLPNPVVADSVGTWPEMWADNSLFFGVALTDSDGTPLPGGAWSSLGPAKDATLASLALALAAQSAAELAQAAAEAAQAMAEALLADVTGEPFNATSSSAISIGTGLKVFAINQAGTLYSEGQTVVAAKTGAAKNQMTGVITAVALDGVTNKQTITIDVPAGGYAAPDGVGPYNAWTISLSASGGVASVAGLAGVISAAALKAALTLTSADLSDFNTATDNRAAALAIALGRRR